MSARVDHLYTCTHSNLGARYLPKHILAIPTLTDLGGLCMPSDGIILSP